MLLIDASGQLRCVPAGRTDVPYVRERLGPDLDAARACLAGHAHDWHVDLTLSQALAEADILPFPTTTTDLRETAARALADGRLPLARAARPDIAMRFDPIRPAIQHGTNAIVFPSLAGAEDFAASLLRLADHASQVDAALPHPAGKRFVEERGRQHGQPAGSARGEVPADAQARARMKALAERLHAGQLLLVPTDVSQLAWLLAWQAPSVTLRVERAPPPAPTPPPAPSAYAPPPMPRSPMPVAPETLSPQALALKEAAKHGIPFCEECARRAAELADAA